VIFVWICLFYSSLYAKLSYVFTSVCSRASCIVQCDSLKSEITFSQINPDSAKGYKARGMAQAMLGHWEKAAKDLHLASTLDYDEEIKAVLKKVSFLSLFK
jgi:hypothetical protein